MQILFQGDSITDAGRDRSDYRKLAGYSQKVKDILGEDNDYINLGISGHRIRDLIERFDSDFENINPDVMVLLIGINDVWRAYDCGDYNPPEVFGKQLDEYLAKVKAKFPKMKIILLEPFILPAPDKIYWREGHLARTIEEVRNNAVKYADDFIPLDGIFARARLNYSWQDISADGVHPYEKGQEIMAKEVAKAINNL